jgi:DNA polymerase-3 subunit epsilon
MRHNEPVGCFPTGRHYPGIAHLLRIVASGLAEEFASDHAMNALRFVSIDTETTGRDPTQDRVVEIACITWEGGQIVRRRSWLVNPERPIPQEAFEVHGIGDDHVKDKPTFREIADEVLRELEGAVALAYNAEYDRKVLQAELARVAAAAAPFVPASERQPPAVRRAVDWIDPLVWARELQKFEKGKSLGDVTQRLGITIEQAHRAEHDAEAALLVMLAFLPDTRVPRTYGAFLQEQRRLSRIFDEERRVWRSKLPEKTA